MDMTIKVLMVTDGEGGYHAQGARFGLTELVKALEEGGCTVTKAHRYPEGDAYAAGADIKNFKFGAGFQPDDYDEVWLMGFASSNPNGPYQDPSGFALSPQEVEVLAKFMNSGGGVFATGDHDDLGADLCAKVPRVRSMRKWEADYSWWQQFQNNPNLDFNTIATDPNKSPAPIGPHRLDTLQKGHNSAYEFQDQSDDVPQQIDPVMRLIRSHVTHVAGGTFGWYERMPHPLLCSTEGVIRVLPDHMHEGRCLVPEDLTKTFTIDGNPTDEYPALSNGVRVSPEEVAWATVHGRKRDPNVVDPEVNYNASRDSNKNVEGDYYPVIAAYNGHRVKVGRVVVDATFHHFVNINVTGVKSDFADEGDPVDSVKGQGFLASADGQEHYARIKAYWRNIAHWIARPSKIRIAAWDLFREIALDVRLKQTAPVAAYDRAPAKMLTQFGATAWKLAVLRAAPCKVLSFVLDIAIPDPLSMLLSPEVYVDLTLPDPPPELRLRKDLLLDRLELVYAALGAAMIELRQPAMRRALIAREIDAEKGLTIVERAAAAGLHKGLTQQAARMSRTLAALEKTVALSGKLQQQSHLSSAAE
jgi:hypothetical protein